MLIKGIEVTAVQTIELIQNIRILMLDYKHRIRNDLPKIYSQDLLNNLFRHPYTKIEFLQNELQISRLTATKYLNTLVEHNFLTKHVIGKSYYYINQELFQLLQKPH